MIFKDKVVRFKITIEMQSVSKPPAQLDLVITRPDHSCNYDTGGVAAGAVYVPPGPMVSGSFIFDYIFDEEGLWKIELDAGNPKSHSIIYTELVNIVTHTNKSENTLYLP